MLRPSVHEIRARDRCAATTHGIGPRLPHHPLAEAYAAKRLPRTTAPQGPGRLLFAPALVGTSAEIAGRLHAHAAFREIDEVAFALPFTFDHEDYVQILTDIATKPGPELGRRPAA